jgi:hypothetical protein
MADLQDSQRAGYSQRALVEKLGIKPGQRVLILAGPDHYVRMLGQLPAGVTLLPSDFVSNFAAPSGDLVDFIQFFTASAAELAAAFPALKSVLAKDGLLWISWPKKSAKMATDVDENVVRAIGLDCGLVDVKVAAIDLTWSGLKFVYRKMDR